MGGYYAARHLNELLGSPLDAIVMGLLFGLCAAVIVRHEVYYYEYRKRSIYKKIMKDKAQPPVTKEEALKMREAQKKAREEKRENRKKESS